MRIRTAIFVVYVVASAAGFVAMMGLVLRDVRLRYVESMRRTLGDTAAYLASYAAPTTAGDDQIRAKGVVSTSVSQSLLPSLRFTAFTMAPSPEM